MSRWPDWDVLVGDGNAAISAPVVRLNASHVVFEWYRQEPALLMSQTLPDFKVRRNAQEVFSGQAVVVSMLSLGAMQVIEVRLAEPGLQLSEGPSTPVQRYEAFLDAWQQGHLVPDDFKLACVNLHSYLTSLRAAAMAEEVYLRGLPVQQQAGAEKELLEAWAPQVMAAIEKYHEDFELAAERINPADRGPAEALVRRLLSPLFLSAPFGHRTFYKPLGYAGDYEMMGMIMRNTFEGDSLYARLVHYWLVQQWAALSVRNRIRHLERRLQEEAVRAVGQRRPFRVLNIGCGPAWEVQRFIRDCPLADRSEFTLVDFESNAMQFVAVKTAEANAAAGRRARITTTQMSVNQLIKESLRSAKAPLGRDFDMVYCVGLFDYLPVKMCQQLTEMFHEWTIPGGLVAVANMKDEKPYRHMVEHLLDWHLLYRSAADMAAFVPASVSRPQWSVVGEQLAVNLFLEIRKAD